MKNESVEEFLARGGKVQKIGSPSLSKNWNVKSRYKMKDLDMSAIIQKERWLAKEKRIQNKLKNKNPRSNS